MSIHLPNYLELTGVTIDKSFLISKFGEEEINTFQISKLKHIISNMTEPIYRESSKYFVKCNEYPDSLIVLIGYLPCAEISNLVIYNVTCSRKSLNGEATYENFKMEFTIESFTIEPRLIETVYDDDVFKTIMKLMSQKRLNKAVEMNPQSVTEGTDDIPSLMASNFIKDWQSYHSNVTGVEFNTQIANSKEQNLFFWILKRRDTVDREDPIFITMMKMLKHPVLSCYWIVCDVPELLWFYSLTYLSSITWEERRQLRDSLVDIDNISTNRNVFVRNHFDKTSGITMERISILWCCCILGDIQFKSIMSIYFKDEEGLKILEESALIDILEQDLSCSNGSTLHECREISNKKTKEIQWYYKGYGIRRNQTSMMSTCISLLDKRLDSLQLRTPQHLDDSNIFASFMTVKKTIMNQSSDILERLIAKNIFKCQKSLHPAFSKHNSYYIASTNQWIKCKESLEYILKMTKMTSTIENDLDEVKLAMSKYMYEEKTPENHSKSINKEEWLPASEFSSATTPSSTSVTTSTTASMTTSLSSTSSSSTPKDPILLYSKFKKPRYIKSIFEADYVRLDAHQRKGLSSVENNGFTLWSCPGGTGKTSCQTYVKGDVGLQKKKRKREGNAVMYLVQQLPTIIRAAPTNAQRNTIQSKIGSAITVESLLRTWRSDPHTLSEVITIILDEFSMIGEAQLNDLMFMCKCLPNLKRILISMDPYQLPSVSRGNVPQCLEKLKPIIKWNEFKKCYRAESTLIFDICNQIKVGKMDFLKQESIFEEKSPFVIHEEPVNIYSWDFMKLMAEKFLKNPKTTMGVCYTHDWRNFLNLRIMQWSGWIPFYTPDGKQITKESIISDPNNSIWKVRSTSYIDPFGMNKELGFLNLSKYWPIFASEVVICVKEFEFKDIVQGDTECIQSLKLYVKAIHNRNSRSMDYKEILSTNEIENKTETIIEFEHIDDPVMMLPDGTIVPRPNIQMKWKQSYLQYFNPGYWGNIHNIQSKQGDEIMCMTEKLTDRSMLNTKIGRTIKKCRMFSCTGEMTSLALRKAIMKEPPVRYTVFDEIIREYFKTNQIKD
jgi:hypothetical protein